MFERFFAGQLAHPSGWFGSWFMPRWDGGKFVLCFDAKEDLERWPGHGFGFRLYDPAEVQALFRQARFAITALETRSIPDYGKVHCLTAQAI